MNASTASTGSRATRVLGIVTLLMLGALALYGLVLTDPAPPPPDGQGDAMRLIYVHVPSATYLYVGCFFTTFASALWLWKRTPGWDALAEAGAEVALVFSFITLGTGSLWGRPTWGTWWEWDGRLTSMLVLFFLYLGYIALGSADRERGGEGRITAIYGLVGAINLPIIHYSVLWWRTLHQGQSISVTGGSSIDNSILWPLPLTMVGFTCLFGAAVLMRMRAELAETKVEARLRRMSR